MVRPCHRFGFLSVLRELDCYLRALAYGDRLDQDLQVMMAELVILAASDHLRLDPLGVLSCRSRTQKTWHCDVAVEEWDFLVCRTLVEKNNSLLLEGFYGSLESEETLVARLEEKNWS